MHQIPRPPLADVRPRPEFEPANAVTHACAGRSYLDFGRWEEAAAPTTRPSSLNPTSAGYYEHRSRILDQLGRDDRAAADFETCLDLELKANPPPDMNTPATDLYPLVRAPLRRRPPGAARPDRAVLPGPHQRGRPAGPGRPGRHRVRGRPLRLPEAEQQRGLQLPGPVLARPAEPDHRRGPAPLRGGHRRGQAGPLPVERGLAAHPPGHPVRRPDHGRPEPPPRSRWPPRRPGRARRPRPRSSRLIEAAVAQRACYRGKVLSLEAEDRTTGTVDGHQGPPAPAGPAGAGDPARAAPSTCSTGT